MFSRTESPPFWLACPSSRWQRWGQLAPSPDASPVSNAPAPPPDEKPVATFKQTVNLVDLFFTIKDNNLIPHETREPLGAEDKAPQSSRRLCGRDQSAADAWGLP